MAKPRKAKNSGEMKSDNAGAVVRHQKLCLSIDIDKRRIFGFTELEITVPDIGIVGLHAENLEIESISVDGEPAEYEYYPRHQQVENEKRWSFVSSPSSAADAAGSVYLSSLERELVPNLLINCCKAFRNGNEQQEQLALENGGSHAGEAKQSVRLVHIDYWVEKAEAGIHFSNYTVHTDNQMRRARCWFPCMDDSSNRCCYDLEFTVAHNLVAVSVGTLLYQVLSKDDPPRKTYVYRLDIPVNPHWITLAVAPFEILPDNHVNLVSHMCMPTNLTKLRNTVEVFHSAFSCYKDYLSAKFPLGSYKQVFIEPEMAVSSSSLGASMCIFSSHFLFDEKIIDQTIDTTVKLAYALARQWFGVYISPEVPNDDWLLDGLAGFLADFFIKKYFGNNEARYRRYKASSSVCKADDSGATALSSSTSCKDLYGTQQIGVYGKIRSWKSVAILHMLEKKMGPESFRKILQTIVSRAEDTTCSTRSLSTKEFRQYANKIGNLERSFLKEFFPRWVGMCGCPVLRMGFSYNKRKNMVELAVLRGCTAMPGANSSEVSGNKDTENRDGDTGWPGVMNIRAYEVDGVYDHPVLPMTGEPWQLLEIQCYSRLAARRLQKTKKGSKPDGSDDNGDVPAQDVRSSVESPLLWLRADPEMEYLSEIHFNQPIQMWINQLEKEKDVAAQAQAIATLEMLPHLSFSVVNALNNFLTDSKAFWRVRIDAAFALATTASEDTDWAGLHNLIKFYKSRRFDANIGLPKPNDFHDFAEYFVLETIPHTVAMVRAADKKSPREAVEFVLQLLKYNDNNGNPYSDAFWLAALVQSVGELEFGQQSILLLASLLKRIDRLLQFDRLMPSYNGILTISCIRTLTQLALKLSGFLPLDRVVELISPFRKFNKLWQVQIEASRALLDLEFHSKGIDAAISLFVKYLEEELSLRGQAKLGVHAMRLCQMRDGSDCSNIIKSDTLVTLLRLLESHMAFNNVYLRHHLFCILQVLAGRPQTLYGVPRDRRTLHMDDAETFSEQKNMFAVLVSETNPLEPSVSTLKPLEPPDAPYLPPDTFEKPEVSKEAVAVPEVSKDSLTIPEVSMRAVTIPGVSKETGAVPEVSKEAGAVLEVSEDAGPVPKATTIPVASKEADSFETKKSRVKITLKSSAATSRVEEADNRTVERSHGGHQDTDHGASSSVSVDAPQRNFVETLSVCNQNLEEVNSCHDRGSRMTASIGSAKIASDGDEVGKELQCTADSSRAHAQPQADDPSSSSFIHDSNVDANAQKYASLQILSTGKQDTDGDSLAILNSPLHEKKEKKKDKEKKRKRDHKGDRNDPEYLERKRLKKEKRQKKKEMAKLLKDEATKPPIITIPDKKEEPEIKSTSIQMKPNEPSRSRSIGGTDARPEASEGTSAAPPKLRIKIKTRVLSKS